VTPQTTWLGAAAGATPPLIGWAAATGALSAKAWALFGIQFLWQIPHFLALFWIYREDYARAGFRVMPVVHPDGGTTAAQIAIHSFTLLPATLLPVVLGMAGFSYAVSALLIGIVFLGLGLRASWTLAHSDARRLFLASLAYLPLIFGMLFFGGV
jgi:protoheme IX farnesyltransferase